MIKFLIALVIYVTIGSYFVISDAMTELAELCPTSDRKAVGMIAELAVYGEREEIEARCQQLDFGLNGPTILSLAPDIALWLPHRLGWVEREALIEVEK